MITSSTLLYKVDVYYIVMQGSHTVKFFSPYLIIYFKTPAVSISANVVGFLCGALFPSSTAGQALSNDGWTANLRAAVLLSRL